MSIIRGRNRVVGLWLRVLVPDGQLSIPTTRLERLSVKKHSNDTFCQFSIYRGLAVRLTHFIDSL